MAAAAAPTGPIIESPKAATDNQPVVLPQTNMTAAIAPPVAPTAPAASTATPAATGGPAIPNNPLLFKGRTIANSLLNMIDD